jgi:hypothetical protein
VKGEDALLEQQHEGVEGMARHGRRCGEGRGNAARAAAQMDSRGLGGSAEAEANQPNAWTRDTMLSDRFWENTSHPKEGGWPSLYSQYGLVYKDTDQYTW